MHPDIDPRMHFAVYSRPVCVIQHMGSSAGTGQNIPLTDHTTNHCMPLKGYNRSYKEPKEGKVNGSRGKEMRMLSPKGDEKTDKIRSKFQDLQN